jgi:hypothetical protein
MAKYLSTQEASSISQPPHSVSYSFRCAAIFSMFLSNCATVVLIRMPCCPMISSPENRIRCFLSR